MESTEAPPKTDDGKTKATWMLDMGVHQTVDGSPFQSLVVVEHHTNLILAAEPGKLGELINGPQIANCLDRVAAKHDYPNVISTDRSKVFSSEAVKSWADEHGVKHDFQASYNPASGCSERVFRTFESELHEGSSKVEAPGWADCSRRFAEFVAHYNESRLKA